MADPIRPFPASLDRDTLIELLLAEAEPDEGLAEGIRPLKQAMTRVTRTYGFLRYRDVRG